ncbi:protein of unknown function [uncultured Sphingopyxis sp.]|uniref:Uncharacterized protein n=1 Tax=uncultured Sphingopyxis sp. TaxID=310581 RepID=A0A1Y5PX40_9SPHN|nr:protein of unknown function [uncultured Sphingopyxis sp.]
MLLMLLIIGYLFAYGEFPSVSAT